MAIVPGLPPGRGFGAHATQGFVCVIEIMKKIGAR